MVDPEPISFTGAQETALATLYGRALESRRRDSVLCDREADRAVQRIDYDFNRLRIRRRDQKTTAIRAKAYDSWVQRFLQSHPEGTVLNLGCGLDTRVYRVDPPSNVRWYDIDLPGVIELRRRLFAEREGLHTVAASVTDAHLLDAIPGETPLLMVAEGLSPYLRAADGIAMLRRITEHFPSGEMIFDGYSRLGVRLVQRYGPVKASRAQRLGHRRSARTREGRSGSDIRRRMAVRRRTRPRAPLFMVIPTTLRNDVSHHPAATARSTAALPLRSRHPKPAHLSAVSAAHIVNAP